jgi:hypothetical protein
MGPQSAAITCSDSVHTLVLVTLKLKVRERGRGRNFSNAIHTVCTFTTEMYKRHTLQNIIPDVAVRALGTALCNKENRY